MISKIKEWIVKYHQELNKEELKMNKNQGPQVTGKYGELYFRDYMAVEFMKIVIDKYGFDNWSEVEMARVVYKLADAMLEVSGD